MKKWGVLSFVLSYILTILLLYLSNSKPPQVEQLSGQTVLSETQLSTEEPPTPSPIVEESPMPTRSPKTKTISKNTPIPTSTSIVTPTPTAFASIQSNASASSTSQPAASSSASATPSPSPCATLGSYSLYDTGVLYDQPVAYYPFAGAQSGCDVSGRGHEGVISGTLQTKLFPNGETAPVFDGESSYITIPNHDDLSIPTTGKLTIEAWISPSTLQFVNEEGSGYVYWLGKGVPGEHEYVTRMYSLVNSENRPNRISGYAFNASGGLGVGSYFQDATSVDKWIHYALVINTIDVDATYPLGYTKIYKNGTMRDKDNLATLGIVPTSGTAPLRIGTRDLQSFFAGAVGKVALYSHELSPYRVQAHYQAMIPPIAGSSQFVQNVGKVSTKTAGTSLQIAVQNSVSAGNTVIVRVLTDYTSGAPTISDSKGNTYLRDRTAPNSGNTLRATLYSATITTALEPDDVITITSANVSARAAVADEFSGLLTANYLDQINGTSNSNTTPGTTISITTTQADDLLVGFVGVEGSMDDTYMEDDLGQFTSLSREGTVGDADDTNITVNGGYKSVSEIGTYKYQPTLDPSRNWITFIVSYKAETSP